MKLDLRKDQKTVRKYIEKRIHVTNNEISDEDLNLLFGEMLELRTNGSLGKLPIAKNAAFVIEEFDGRYFWPTYKTRKSEGRIRN